MARHTRSLAALTLTLALGACDVTEPDVARRTYEVAPHMEVCSGLSYGFCLRVREPGASAWQLMYERPVGFVFEWGVTTRIVVDERALDPAPLDASAVRRTLVRVESRDTVPADSIFTLLIPGSTTSSTTAGLHQVQFGEVRFRCDGEPDCADLDTALAGDDAVEVTFALGPTPADPFRVVDWRTCGEPWPGCGGGG